MIDSAITLDLRVVAARDTVLVTGDQELPDGTLTGMVILHSEDGGRSFQRTTLARQTAALAIEPDGESVWLVDDVGELFGSDDAGTTFADVGPAGGPTDCFVFGRHDLYQINSGLIGVSSLANPLMSANYPGLQGSPLAATIDDADVVTTIARGTSNVGGLATMVLIGSRFAVGQTPPADQTIGPSAASAGAVALSRHATAVVGIDANDLTFSIATWP